MAEFSKVIMNWNYMCRIVGCTNCPVNKVLKVSCAKWLVSNPPVKEITAVEDAIEKWAEENLKLVDISWEDAWKQIFPESKSPICPVMFGAYEPYDGCDDTICGECVKRRMPKEVAEKLGIKVE